MAEQLGPLTLIQDIGWRTARAEAKTDTAVTTFTVTKDPALTDGDVVYVHITTNGSPTGLAAPSGFTQVGSVTTLTNPKVYIYRKVITSAAGEGAWTFTVGLITASFLSQTFYNVDTANPEDTAVVSNTTSSMSVTPVAVGSVTTTKDKALLFFGVGCNSSTATITAPSGMSEFVEGGARKSEIDYEVRTTAGATGTRTASASSGVAGAAYMFAIRPMESGSTVKTSGAVAMSATATQTAIGRLWNNFYTNATTGTATLTTGPLTFSHTTSNATNRAIFIGVAVRAPSGHVASTAVTWNSVAATMVGRTQIQGDHSVEIWRILNPAASTTANVSISWNDTRSVIASAVTVPNVDQASPTRTYTSAGGGSATTDVTVDVASAQHEFVLAYGQKINNDTITSINDQTIYDVWNSSDVRGVGFLTIAAGATTTVGFTQPAHYATLGAVGVRKAVSSTVRTSGSVAMTGDSSASATGSKPTGTYTPQIGAWRWYTDAATDGAMTPLAAQNTVPTLTGAQVMGGILRLRTQFSEVGGASGSLGAITLQYSVDGTNWTEVPPQNGSGVSSWQNRHVRWADGARTNAATLDSTLLSGTTTSGTYQEAQFTATGLAANERREYDFAFKMIWPMPDTTYKVRILVAGTPIAAPTEIQFTTCTAAQRSYTIARAEPNTSAGQNREINHSPWPRMFWDGSNWWTFVTQPALSTSSIYYYRWDGSGAWSAPSTVAGGAGTITSTSEADVRHAPYLRTISGTPVVGIGLFPSTSNMRYLRGYISGGTITWASSVDVGAARPGTQNATAIDQGGFHWIGGINGTSGVWARRSTAADTGGTSYVPAFGSAITVADAGVAAGNIPALVPLASNRVLMIWRNGNNLRASEVTGSGFGPISTVNTTAAINPDDWGATFDGSYVYVIHTDTNGIGGTWKTRVYDIGTSTWANGVDPGITGQISNADGLVVTALPSGGCAIFGTDVGTEGGQDRTIQSKTYTGGTAGTWGSKVVITPAGGRGNGDDIAGPYVAGNGQIPILYLHGDCDTNGIPFAYEYHVLSVGGATKTSGAVAVDGIATLTVVSRHIQRAASALDAAGTATATAHRIQRSSSPLTAASSMTALGRKIGATSTAQMTAIATQTVIGRRIQRRTVAMSAASNMSAVGTEISSTTASDNFNDNSMSATWTTSTSGTGFAVNEIRDQLELSLPSGVAGSAALLSASAQAITGTSFFVEAVRVAPNASAYTTKFQYGTLTATSPKVAIGTYTSSGALRLGFFTSVANGAQNTVVASTPWSATAHHWWRLRESGGVVYADISDDSVTWTHPDGLPDGTTAWKVTSSTLSLVASPIVMVVAASDTTGSPSDTIIFDNMNINRVSSAGTSTAALSAASNATAQGQLVTTRSAQSALTAAANTTAIGRKIQRRPTALTADGTITPILRHIQRRTSALSAAANTVASGFKVVPVSSIGGLTRVAGAEAVFLSRTFDPLTWTLTRDGTEPTVFTASKSFTDIF